MYPRRAAHPHVCGEHQTVVNDGFIRHGSSPRVWGALHTRQPTLASARLIPTCVGSTTAWGALMPWNSAHPHVCGEHVPERLERLRGIGSSPRVWGAHGRYGKPSKAHQAHPHVCGEHATLITHDTYFVGSSPRVWGAPTVDASIWQDVRLIPTCVGSTPGSARHLVTCPAHPHVCGEHYGFADVDDYRPGSSPRVWGARDCSSPSALMFRLIPTCVGSTKACMGGYPGRQAHPHVCGEHSCSSGCG